MNNIVDIINQSQVTNLSIPIILANILLSAVTSSALAWFYVNYGLSLSNRQRLARNFLLISVTTTLVITVIKSSLALSLGLVGALSIVRFRSAIKEPEELAYLFLSVSIGLGFGANQHLITVIAFLTILILVYLQSRVGNKKGNENYFLSVKFANLLNKKVDVSAVAKALMPHCIKLDLKRIDQSKSSLSLGFYVEFSNLKGLEKSIKSLKKISKSVEVSYIDQSGIVV